MEDGLRADVSNNQTVRVRPLSRQGIQDYGLRTCRDPTRKIRMKLGGITVLIRALSAWSPCMPFWNPCRGYPDSPGLKHWYPLPRFPLMALAGLSPSLSDLLPDPCRGLSAGRPWKQPTYKQTVFHSICRRHLCIPAGAFFVSQQC